MGAPMAKNLHRAGLLEAVWNRSSDKAAALAAELGCQSPASLADFAARRRCRRGLRVRRCGRARGHRRTGAGACARARSSSTAPPSARTPRAGRNNFSPRAAVQFLDAPVSGGVEGAQKGTLAIMTGGDPAAFERARPVLAAMGKTIEHFGPAGAGQATKATNQIMCAGIIRACAEAMAFAGAHELPLDRVVSTLGAGAGSSWYFVHRAPNMVRGSYPAGFRIKLHAKDLAHLPRHGGALRRVAARGRFDAGRIRGAHGAGLRRRRHLRDASPQAGAVRGRRETRRMSPAAASSRSASRGAPAALSTQLLRGVARCSSSSSSASSPRCCWRWRATRRRSASGPTSASPRCSCCGSRCAAPACCACCATTSAARASRSAPAMVLAITVALVTLVSAAAPTTSAAATLLSPRRPLDLPAAQRAASPSS